MMLTRLRSAKKKEEAPPVARNLEESGVPRAPTEETMPSRNRQPNNGAGGKKTKGTEEEEEDSPLRTAREDLREVKDLLRAARAKLVDREAEVKALEATNAPAVEWRRQLLEQYEAKLDVEELKAKESVLSLKLDLLGSGKNPLDDAKYNGISDRLLELEGSREEKIKLKEQQLRQDYADRTLTPLPSLPSFLHLKEKRLVRHNFDYVAHPAYAEATMLIVEMLEVVPVDEGREFKFPALIGPMGIGKTRTCEEVCTHAQQDLAAKGKPLIVIKVNIKDFSRDVPTAGKVALDILGQALVFGAFRVSESLVRFSDVVEKVTETGAKTVLLYLDEIQFDRPLVKKLLEACDSTMRDALLGLSVVPIVSGLSSPSFRTLPSGGLVTPIEVKPLPLKSRPLLDSFCTAIGIEIGSLDDCPNLSTLFTLCDGRPNLISTLIAMIRNRAAADSSFQSTLPNISVNHAEDVFQDVIVRASSTYGIGRWHALLGADMTDNDDEDSIRNRESFQPLTLQVIKRLMLDACVDRIIPSLSSYVVAHPHDDSINRLKDRFPTYQKCVESGIFVIKDKVVRIPLIPLLVMDRIVNVLPHKSLKSPFDPNWGGLEVIGMAAIYLRLLSASNLGIQRMKLKDLRPGADWNGCDDVEIIVPTENELRFVFLGAKVADGSTVINEGADGLGNPLELHPGTVAVTFPNQPGWDGFTFLEATVDGGSYTTSLIIATQVKHREANVGNGVESMTKLGNAEFKRILKQQMEPVFGSLTSVFDQSFAEDSVVVFDVYSDRLEPVNSEKGLDSVGERYCLTRGQAFEQATGTPLSQICKRVRLSD